MFKKIFFHSIISGILASAAGIIYDRIYFFATEVDFSKVLNTGSIIGLNIMVCFAAGIIFFLLKKWMDKKGEIVFNFLFSIISFAGVMIPISISLPLKIQMPELFPGLAVPMVFFPVMAWYTIRPIYKYA
jgi:hypothetical protein